jgi:hypothetical protein
VGVEDGVGVYVDVGIRVNVDVAAIVGVYASVGSGNLPELQAVIIRQITKKKHSMTKRFITPPVGL